MPGAGVGVGALAMHRQATAVTDALVAPDLDLAADISCHLAAQVTLDAQIGFDPIAQRDDLIVGEIAGPQIRADTRGNERLGSA